MKIDETNLFLLITILMQIRGSQHGKVMMAITKFSVQNSKSHIANVNFINLPNGSIIVSHNHTVLVQSEKETVSFIFDV